jgi:5-methylcytosine-specific restriction endonuclease McrA
VSRTHVPAELRARVRERASGICEYCLLSEGDIIHPFHVDHVISQKHGGPTEDHNLAFCCPFCNRAKGSDIASQIDGAMVRLYNPRIDQWREHFSLRRGVIEGRTNVGRATTQLLRLNETHRLKLRVQLESVGLFPSPAAMRHLP